MKVRYRVMAFPCREKKISSITVNLPKSLNDLNICNYIQLIVKSKNKAISIGNDNLAIILHM